MSVDLCKLCIENKSAFCYNVGVKEEKGMNDIKNETILQAQLGVPEALDVIIDTYSKLAYYQAVKYLQIRDDAKDCAQEAISKIVLNLKDYNPKLSNFNTWTYVIIRNTILNYKRHESMVKERIIVDDKEVENYCIYEDKDGKILLSEVEQAVGEYKYRILISRIGYGKSFVEIGRMLNIPHYAAKRLYDDALYEAKRYIKEQKDEVKIRERNYRGIQREL